MAMEPPLCMYDIRPTRPGAAAGKLERSAGEFPFFQILHQRLQFRFVIDHKLDVITGGPTDVAGAVLIGNIAYLGNMRDPHHKRPAHPYGEHLLTRLGDMHQSDPY